MLDTPPSEKPNPRPEVQVPAAEAQEDEGSGTLDCKKCNRKFCNRRQITKHICIIGLREEVDEEEENGTGACTVHLLLILCITVYLGVM